MAETRRGFLLGAAAYAMWGLFPLYWPLLRPAGAIEILAHRIFWSLIVTVLLVVALGRVRDLRGVIEDRRTIGILALAAAVIAVNWAPTSGV